MDRGLKQGTRRRYYLQILEVCDTTLESAPVGRVVVSYSKKVGPICPISSYSWSPVQSLWSEPLEPFRKLKIEITIVDQGRSIRQPPDRQNRTSKRTEGSTQINKSFTNTSRSCPPLFLISRPSCTLLCSRLGVPPFSSNGGRPLLQRRVWTK